MTFSDDGPVQDDDHVVSCERIFAAAQVLRGFANIYVDKPAGDVSPLERARVGGSRRLDGAGDGQVLLRRP
jgi:hypothetical protein